MVDLEYSVNDEAIDRPLTSKPAAIVIEDIPSEEERAYSLYPHKYFPRVGSLDDIVHCVP